MKSFILIIFLFLNLLSAEAQELFILSYNIRYDNPNDGANRWEYRKEALVDQIIDYKADFVGVQEALLAQMEFLESRLEHFGYIGVGRDDGKTSGEFSAIFYDSLHFVIIESNTIWLSDDPMVIKAGWDAALPRICTYGLFKNKMSGDSIWMINTHFDHRGKEARKNSAIQIVGLIDSLTAGSQVPVFLMGDFNASPEDEPIHILKQKLKDSFTVKRSDLFEEIGTFNGFGNDLEDRRIDYIFCKGCEFQDYRVDRSMRENAQFISDHFPVFIEAKY